MIPDWEAFGVTLCGYIMMYDSELNLQMLTPLTDHFEDRRVFMQELPNPMNN